MTMTRFHWLSKLFQILKANEILSSSFKEENSLKLCPATSTMHNHREKFKKMLKNLETNGMLKTWKLGMLKTIFSLVLDQKSPWH